MTPLYEHTNEQNAYLIDSYPYGQLRCKIKFWLESHPRRGFRAMSQTQNPKNNKWNAPRKGTYYILGGCMYLDDNNHVQYSMLSEYSKSQEILEFIQKFPQADLSKLKTWIKAKKALNNAISQGTPIFRINGILKKPSETEIESAKSEIIILEQCANLLNI